MPSSVPRQIANAALAKLGSTAKYGPPIEQLKNYARTVGKDVFLDNGCDDITNDALVKETRALLEKYQIDTVPLNDAVMLDAIQLGINKEMKIRHME